MRPRIEVWCIAGDGIVCRSGLCENPVADLFIFEMCFLHRTAGEVNNDIVVEMKTDKANEEAGLLNKQPPADQVRPLDSGVCKARTELSHINSCIPFFFHPNCLCPNLHFTGF